MCVVNGSNGERLADLAAEVQAATDCVERVQRKALEEPAVPVVVHWASSALDYLQLAATHIRERRRLVVLLACMVGLVGCGQTPLQPTAKVQLTVQVLVEGTNLPIAGATVYVDGEPWGPTGEQGLCAFKVEQGRTIKISVVKAGYRPSIATEGTPRDGDVWSFWLRPDSVNN